MNCTSLCRAAFTSFIMITVYASIAYAQQSEVLEGEYVVQRAETPQGMAAAAAALSSTNLTVLGSSLNAQLVRPGSRKNRFISSQVTPTKVPYDRALAKKECAEIMASDPSIISCDPNFVMYNQQLPNDPLTSQQDSTLPAGTPYQFFHFYTWADGINSFHLRSNQAWDIQTGSKDIIIGILDSGINYEHPDLLPNLWVNPGDPPNGKDDDGNGFVDDIFGIDAANGTNDPFDCNGHGSHVAGLIGAKGNNGKGGAGVAWDVSLIMARNALPGAPGPEACGPSVSLMSAITGINYFYDLKANRGIDITAVNASYSGDNSPQVQYDAIARLASVNIIFVAAAGNNGRNIDQQPAYPAAYDLPNILSVANLDQYNYFPNRLNDSSNFGTTSVDIAAPGTEILSTVYKGDPDARFAISNAERWGHKTGTSMAAPIVAGAIALYKAKHKTQFIDFTRLIQVVLDTGVPVPLTKGMTKTGDTLDLFNLLSSPTLSDNCPSDPSKLDPGACGCGVTERYADSDGDSTLDCKDQCPADAGKIAPGACGCGTSDIDANGNGRSDCFDALVGQIVPAKPSIKKKPKFTVNMTPTSEPGAIYVVKIEIAGKTAGNKKRVARKKKGGKGKGGKGAGNKTSTKFFNSASASFRTSGPKSGQTFNISYFYQIPGAAIFTSQESPKVKVKG
ncbi:MAG: S8 family serine peptidase [Deltaproteobacteria bacterium]|nr:S8 family serine peptidase [Deltaproteobacteria bacterium]